ncbi:glycoside hydrolase family 38 C-terminal domain-containing protein [Candidatus Enterococcus murrayae]|uniref:Alpha-mannosidase n=1 Tax=Candidatus Enterococcus murrayae TaxID=2815321 RepID=A0ABS3HKD2_9ENTE|nr:glycoside hydrolase family 38 C-terminal domain-containing protein [Enterococcus sp. MJM16]MBO0453911.1 alpha-mannosidase [Enterococcus sp. MJM16]
MQRKVHVIHHTHWDFEWYFTTNESFVQLAYHLDEVMQALEEEQIDYYLLDGQMSILEDYLTSFPEQEERLAQLVKSGKLAIGPWYTQTDELIVRGESIIRNLNLGMKLAESLGGYMNIGYLPDSFGQSKDMPKIYNGFGIQQAVFWRGVPNEVTTKREFHWNAEDGSRVLTSNIKNGYFVGVGLIYSEDADSLVETISEGATGEDLVLPVGGDQRYIDFNLRERIEVYNQKLKNVELIESSYDRFFDAISENELSVVEGEFISSSVSKIHRSIYSSRYDHKYLNDKVERRMIYQAEPLMVMAEKCGIPYKKGLLDRIWKLLNKNHAHDSAGGCNSDKTNQIITDRFVEADQLSYSLVDYLTRKISESRMNLSENELIVFNTLPWKNKKVMKCEVSTPFAAISMEKDGSMVPFELIRTRKEFSGSIRREETDQDPANYYFIHELLVEVEIPALSFVTYQVVENTVQNNKESSKKSSRHSIENADYQIIFEAGELSLIDRKEGTTYKNFLAFEDSGDEGDTYDYSPPYTDHSYRLDLAEASCEATQNTLRSKLVFNGEWNIAKDIQEREWKKRTQVIPYQLTIELMKNSHQIQFHLEIENQASDHRMRVLIDTPNKNDFSYTDTPFGTIKRAVVDRHIDDWRELGWREEPTAIFPMLTYVNSHTPTSSWTVFSKGIKEYQFVGEDFQTIALTLFRSVGYLGRPDLLRRPGIASGNEFKYIPTPDSQLKKKLTFKFALQLDKNYQPAKLSKDYLNYAMSTPYYQIQELNRFTTTLKYFVSNPLKNKVAVQEGIVFDSDKLVFSSLVKTMDEAGFDIRVYNPDFCQEVNGEIIKGSHEMSYTFVDLKGNAVSSTEKNDIIPLGTFKPGEIKTIHIVD